MKRVRSARSPAVDEVVVERLGREGDGVATCDGRTLHVPFTLPGERVRVRLVDERRRVCRGAVLERLSGPAQAAPACPHFGVCGGCRLQHLPDEDYRRFRVRQVVGELRRRHLPHPRPELVRLAPRSRRRLRVAWHAGERVRLGFRQLRSHRLVDVRECPVARPEVAALLPALRCLLAETVAARGRGEAIVTVLPAGCDLLLHLPGQPTLRDRERLARFADEWDLARLSLVAQGAPEPLAVRRPAELACGRFRVPVPPGAFLQATTEGETALASFVAEALHDGARLADLYAGLGVLSLPLAHRLAALRLFEADAAAVEAVATAVRRSGASGNGVERRDLERRPLVASELEAFDLVLLDPPRAGALAQVREIAASGVRHLLYLSCNPASFARDARLLADAGFTVDRLGIVDQFLWSSEVELAARLVRS